jgi:Spx/MgsR family transcriptional regulator
MEKLKEMNIQIFGTKKCFDTKKAERYFKERNIPYQFIDLSVKGMSKGELQSVRTVVGLNKLVNSKCKDYKRLNMDRIITASVREEILLNNPCLYKTPIVRNGRQATVGYEPIVWETWA